MASEVRFFRAAYAIGRFAYPYLRSHNGFAESVDNPFAGGFCDSTRVMGEGSTDDVVSAMRESHRLTDPDALDKAFQRTVDALEIRALPSQGSVATPLRAFRNWMLQCPIQGRSPPAVCCVAQRSRCAPVCTPEELTAWNNTRKLAAVAATLNDVTGEVMTRYI